LGTCGVGISDAFCLVIYLLDVLSFINDGPCLAISKRLSSVVGSELPCLLYLRGPDCGEQAFALAGPRDASCTTSLFILVALIATAVERPLAGYISKYISPIMRPDPRFAWRT
jgi:hypothetical protein